MEKIKDEIISLKEFIFDVLAIIIINQYKYNYACNFIFSLVYRK